MTAPIRSATLTAMDVLGIKKEILPHLSLKGLKTCRQALTLLQSDQRAFNLQIQAGKKRWFNTLSTEEKQLLQSDATSNVRLQEDSFTQHLARSQNLLDRIEEQMQLINREIQKHQ